MELVLYLSAQGLHHEMPGSGPGMTDGTPVRHSFGQLK